ncbi:hypothetical protein MKZ38_008996 [Zalerion maritima]|uniref:Uncharacterized protein n=1 Tax=Zalerion maritima TaxID=339359 RepID=A0AAD5RG92_9PEZI|nr:hypothetical protein MKZ38_008996 [Zalerion maritima]
MDEEKRKVGETFRFRSLLLHEELGQDLNSRWTDRQTCHRGHRATNLVLTSPPPSLSERLPLGIEWGEGPGTDFSPSLSTLPLLCQGSMPKRRQLSTLPFPQQDLLGTPRDVAGSKLLRSFIHKLVSNVHSKKQHVTALRNFTSSSRNTRSKPDSTTEWLGASSRFEKEREKKEDFSRLAATKPPCIHPTHQCAIAHQCMYAKDLHIGLSLSLRRLAGATWGGGGVGRGVDGAGDRPPFAPS